MGRLITESGTSRAIVAANRGEITYFPFNVSAESLVVDTFVSADAISTNTLSANAIVGKWEGLPLESYQVNIEGIDIKATDVPPNRYLKTNYEGVVAWVEETPVDVNNITGDLTVNGNISASGNLSANNIDVTNAILSGGTNINDLFGPGGTLSGIGGGGSANTVAKFSDSTTIADSNISDDGSTVTIAADITSGNLLNITNDEVSKFSVSADGSTTIQGNLSVHGDMHYIDTLVTVTSALSIINSGTGPGLTVEQKGTDEPIAHFIDKEGGEIMFDDAGQVGIGIKTPDQKLTVAGGISASEGLSAGKCSYFDGNVGIGTNTPDRALTVDGKAAIKSGECLLFCHSANNNAAAIRSHTSGTLQINTGGVSCALYLTNAGNFGIGAGDSPEAKLTVQGNISADGTLSASGDIDADGDLYLDGNIYLDEDQRIFFEEDEATWIETDSADRLRFVAGGKQMLLLDQDTGDRAVFGFGTKVGINVGNNTTPASYLTVAGDISASEGLSAKNIDSAFNILSAGTDLIDIFAPASGGGYIDGSGTANTIAKFSDSNTIANSNITDDGSTVKVCAPLSGDDYIKGHQFCLGANSRVDNPATNNLGLYANNELGLELVSDTRVCSHHDLTVNGTISASSNLSAGGRFFAPNGSAAAPTFSFSDFPGTGLLMADTDTLGIATRGSLRMAVDESGNVGIGEASPPEKLTVDGNIRINGNSREFYFAGDQAQIRASSAATDITFVNSSTELVRFASDGKVGIGVTNPGVTLTVQGGISASGGLSAGNLDLVGGSGTTNFIPKFTDSDTLGDSIAYIGSDNINIEGGLSALQGLSADNNIYGGGCVNHFVNNVGINIANPSEKLTIQGALSSSNKGVFHKIGLGTNGPDLRLEIDVDAADDGILLTANNGARKAVEILAESATNGGADIKLYGGVNGLCGRFTTQNDSFLSGSNFGLGTNAPKEKLTVVGGISASEGLSAGKTSYFADKVGIGTAAPNKNLTVAGDISATGCYYVPDTGQIRVGDGGDLVIQHDGNYSYITEQGQNDLFIQPNNSSLYVRDAISGNIMIAAKSGSGKIVELYAGGSKKLATNSSGVTVTGDATINGSVSASDGLSANNLDSAFNILSAGTDLTDIFGPGGSAGNINGSGTACYLPVWSDADTIGNSIALQTSTVLSVAGSISAQGYCSTATNTKFGTQALNDTSGGQNTAIGLQAMLANTSGYQNVAVGEAALQCNTEGLRNTAVGCGALLSNTTGDCNVALGCRAGYSNQTGNSQVAIGSQALYSSTVGENVAVGSCAATSNTTGAQNVAVGHKALCSNTIGTCNVAIGFHTLTTTTTACGNVAVGNYALCANTCGEKNVAVGNYALASNTEAWYNVAIGHCTLNANTTGEYNVGIGRQPLNANTTGVHNIGIGRQALWCNTTGCHNIALGQSSLYCNETGCYNVAIGGCAMNCNIGGYFNVALGCGTMYHANSGYHNNAIGYLALYCNFGGHGNNAFGRDALYCNTLGNCNDAMGYRALYKNTTGSSNVAIGAFSMSNAAPGDYNVAVGKYSLNNNTSTRNTAVGYYSLYNNTGADNTAVGYNAAGSNTSGYYNTAVGRGALSDNQTGNNNTAIGYCAMHENEADNNTGLGMWAMLCNTSGSRNTAIGRSALQCNTTASGNTAVGYHAGFANTTGACNTVVGEYALCSNTTGCRNVALGRDAMCLNTTGDFNTSVGYQSMFDNISGYQNVALGYAALGDNTKGHNNVAIGESALRKNIEAGANTAVGKSAAACNTTGVCNAALGYQALNRNTDGDKNAALGACALFSNTVGSNNIGVGYHSLLQATTATQNIAVGSGAMYSNCHGCANVAIGHQALYSNKCSYNVAIGDLALNAQTTGYYNTAVGALASRCMTTGTVNTAVGMYAMHNNTTASRNTALGYGALFSNDEGGDNTAVGSNALCKNTASLNTAVGGCALICQTTGGCNTALGYQAMLKNCDGIKNVGIGAQVMCAGSGGDYNTAVGYQANRCLTTGTTNSVFGYQALYSNTTGCSNVALGASTLYSNVTGDWNVAIGHSALYNNNKTGYNTAVGHEALCSSIDATDSVAVGFRALCKATASYNTALGSSALRNTTTGCYNMAIGYQTLYNNTEGTHNTAVGERSLYSTNTGIGNTGLGSTALYANTTGCYNVGIGVNAGCNNTDGCCNVSVGYAAGRYLANGSTNLTSPDNSTYIGSCTRGAAVSDSNVTVIGYCACACGDNTVSIGNANVTDTYINGCTSVVGDISASGNGYFTCVIAGGYFEEKAAHPSLAEHPTGSLVVIGEDGNLTLSTSKNDKKIFGVTQKGACQPIILGAEPVLVTGSIKAGDFITTSDKQGHGMKTPNPIWGSIIAQSMEDGTGDSHLVQAMIRKL